MGESIKSKAVKNGRNFDLTSLADDRYVRCSRCGWICHLDRDVWSQEGSYEGWGLSYPTQTTDVGAGSTIPSATNTLYVYDDQGNIVYDDNGNPVIDDIVFTPAYTYPGAAIYDSSNTYDSTVTYDGAAFTVTTNDAVVSGGCPQCGTFLYPEGSSGCKG